MSEARLGACVGALLIACQPPPVEGAPPPRLADVQWASAAVHVPYVVWQAYGDAGVIDTARLERDADTMAEMAAATDRTAEAVRYAALSSEVKAAFIARCVQDDGTVAGPGLSKAADRFVARLAARDWYLATGFQGTPEILTALLEAERAAAAWRLEGGDFHLDVVIPPNTTAEVHVPASGSSSIAESGLPAAVARGVSFLGMKGGGAVYAVGSGTYAFQGS